MRPTSRCASSLSAPSSSMSPSTTTARRPARRAASVSSAARTEAGLALYVSSRIVTSPARFQTPRPPTGRAAARPRAMSSRGTSSATPTAAAASALVTLWRPPEATLTGWRPPPPPRREAEPPPAALGAEPQQRERHAPLVVERRGRFEHLPARGEHRRRQLLGRRLADGARDGHDRHGELRAVPRGQPAQRARRVLDEHQRHVGGRLVGQRVDDHAGGAPRGGVAKEHVAVQPMADDREERLAHLQGPRVDRHTADGNAEVAAHQRALGGPNQLLDAERRHTPPYRARSDKSRRATSRSSNGSTSVPTIWYVSCPLPAMTTVSPGPAHPSAAAIAARRSASRA